MKAVVLFALLAACSKDASSAKPTPEQHAQFHHDHPVPAPTGAPKKVAPPKPAELQHVTIKALGMYCEESCPMAVRYAVAENPAIYELGFDTANESIFVSYDAKLGAPKDVTAPIITAIREKAGFDPWLAKESWPADAQALVQVVAR